MVATFFVKGYGYHYSYEPCRFQGLMEVDNPDSSTIIEAIEKKFGFSNYRENKEIVIEQINTLIIRYDE